MKEHFIIKIKPNSLATLPANIPYWENFITDKSVVIEKFEPTLDRLLIQSGFKFWVTRQYKPHANGWNYEEILSGFHLTFRIILQENGTLPDRLIHQIRTLPFVTYVHLITIGTTPIPSTSTTFTYADEDAVAKMIYLPYAKAWTKGTKQIKVAVLDTGIDIKHPEFKDQIIQHKDFVNLQGLDTTSFIGEVTGLHDDSDEDKVGHGTHVTGIIAAKGLNMTEGIAPGCSILSCRVLAPMRTGNHIVGAGIVDNINNGIKWAVDHGADVINMSLGIKHTGGGLPHEDVVNYAINKNVTIVAASGNDGTQEMYYPAALNGVIAVGAVDLTGQVTSFTSYGAPITLVAPGYHIYSSFPDSKYAYLSGTSQASPFVSGSIGLMKSLANEKGIKLSNRQINYILRNTSDRLTDKVRDIRSGFGLLNLADSFKLLNNMLS